MKKKSFTILNRITPTNLLFQLDSAHGRKIILTGLIILTLIFDLLIWNYGQMITQKKYIPSLVVQSKSLLERTILSLVGNRPIKKMAPYLAHKEKKVAVFMVSVAKQESDWGKHAPVLNGQDCYNYWGYRGKSATITHDGYSCFKTPQEAVDIVSQRFSYLIHHSNLDTPQKMIVWKCGWSCANQNSLGVHQWINNVNFYYHKFYE